MSAIIILNYVIRGWITFSRWVAYSFGPDRMVWGSGSLAIVDTQLAHWSEEYRAKVKGGNLQWLLDF
ncbi:MAG: hypothetical protein OTJ43_01175 [Dehalococcoidia bacterium]|nr:hypothetical protein [Dehalococcoidia bacterium]